MPEKKLHKKRNKQEPVSQTIMSTSHDGFFFIFLPLWQIMETRIECRKIMNQIIISKIGSLFLDNMRLENLKLLQRSKKSWIETNFFFLPKENNLRWAKNMDYLWLVKLVEANDDDDVIKTKNDINIKIILKYFEWLC